MNLLRAKPAVALAIGSLAIAAFAGCSGGQDDTEPTRAEFIEQALVICEENNEYLRQAMVDTFGPDMTPDAETGIRFTREIWVPNLRQQNEDLRELDWPEGDRERIETMLDEIDRASERVEADPGLASEGPFDEVTRKMANYGIEPCGSP